MATERDRRLYGNGVQHVRHTEQRRQPPAAKVFCQQRCDHVLAGVGPCLLYRAALQEAQLVPDGLAFLAVMTADVVYLSRRTVLVW